MQGQAEDVLPRGRLEDRQPVPARGVDDELPGLPGPGRGQPTDEVGERVVGDGEDQQLGPRHDLLDGEDGYAGQQLRSPGREASLTAETATTWWPACCSAAPRTAPTRPAPTTPTSRRAGRSSAGFTP